MFLCLAALPPLRSEQIPPKFTWSTEVSEYGIQLINVQFPDGGPDDVINLRSASLYFFVPYPLHIFCAGAYDPYAAHKNPWLPCLKGNTELCIDPLESNTKLYI